MPTTPRGPDEPDHAAPLELFRAIASGDRSEIARRLDGTPGLVACALRVGASRQEPSTYFLNPLRHYVYAGDTALHVAAAADDLGTAELLIARGADVRARNRRGAEPLHYAADGSPNRGPEDRTALIACLISAGAAPDALDKSGVAALHRAVRNRCSSAVSALMTHGADPVLANRSGSTPLHLAVQNTGKSHSGLAAAKAEQRRIIELLLQNGARPSDADAKGKTVEAAASSDWIRELLYQA